MLININNETKEEILKGYKSTIENVVHNTLSLEIDNLDTEINIIIVSDEYIRNLNKKFRGIDKATDVLSFPIIDFEADETIPTQGFYLLGDIFISYSKAIEQADLHGHSIEREIAFLVVHGVLHLLGYDHKTKLEEENMFKKQENILNKMKIFR